MKTLRVASVTSAVLAVLTLGSVLLSHLALTDIAHGEPDLTSEWAILRVSALMAVGLAISSLVLARSALGAWRRLHDPAAA